MWEIRRLGRKTEIDTIIAENNYLLQQTGHKEDLFEFFSFDYLKGAIMPKLSPDNEIFILKLIRTSSSYEEEINNPVESMVYIENSKSIRFFGTLNAIENFK